jgi:hypothetical protein
MSRSFKHAPFLANCSGSEKYDKQKWHRRYRAACRVAIARGVDLPDYRTLSDPWGMNKDGRTWYGRAEIANGLAQYMRK